MVHLCPNRQGINSTANHRKHEDILSFGRTSACLSKSLPSSQSDCQQASNLGNTCIECSRIHEHLSTELGDQAPVMQQSYDKLRPWEKKELVFCFPVLVSHRLISNIQSSYLCLIRRQNTSGPLEGQFII